MSLFEDRSAVFIVRVWCETGGNAMGAVRAWRGSIEHVPSGQRAFFQELDAVITFMKPHLLALGIEEPNRFWERVSSLTASPASPALPPQPPQGADSPPRMVRTPRGRRKH